MKEKQQPERLRGQVTRQLVRQGTASEHIAMVLCMKSGERLILQRIGANPFDDPATRELDGQEVTLQGFRVGDIFRFDTAAVRDAGTN